MVALQAPFCSVGLWTACISLPWIALRRPAEEAEDRLQKCPTTLYLSIKNPLTLALTTKTMIAVVPLCLYIALYKRNLQQMMIPLVNDTYIYRTLGSKTISIMYSDGYMGCDSWKQAVQDLKLVGGQPCSKVVESEDNLAGSAGSEQT